MIKTVAAAAVLLLALTSCSGSTSSDLSADEQKAADSLSASFRSDQNVTSGFTENATEADCIAEQLVREIGTDKLIEYGFLAEDLSADTGAERSNIPVDEAGRIADIFMGCVDIVAIMKSDLKVDQMSESAQTCFDDALTDEAVRTLLIAGFTGDTTVAQDLQTTLYACTLAG